MDDKRVDDAINTYDYDKISAGMLSSPHIAYCVNKYNIIENYDKSCLGSATYNMRIGDKILTWEKGKQVEFILGKQEDRNKNIRTKVKLRPNSLTFITTIEKFNLPKDIIARFNLKSKWVHEGLLLGTGPIVDPELVANLLIPLHNFSSQDVTLHYGDEIISVEFTKTLNPSDHLESPTGEPFKYSKNKSRIFDFDSYRKRIQDKRVESSVSSKFDEYDKTIKKYKNRLNTFSSIGVVAIFAAIVGLISLFYMTVDLISDARTQLDDATNIVKEYKEQNVDLRAFALKSTVNNLQMQLSELKRYNESLSLKYAENLERSASNFKELKKNFKQETEAIEQKIEAIENKFADKNAFTGGKQ